MSRSFNKIFRTIDEQIAILRGKGLIIENDEKTKDLLLRENYFFINGYRHLFMEPTTRGKFLPGTTFEELYALFIFDRKMRNIFFKNILIVENNIKSFISYQLSKKYGFREKDYLNPKNFVQDKLSTRKVKDILNKVYRQSRINGRQHSATTHYMDSYGYIPLWILVKVLSFGIVSEFFAILKPADQSEIAKYYGIDGTTLERYLSLLSNFRNVCAHEDILYDHKTQRFIPDSKYHEMLNIEKIEEIYRFGKNDLYSLVIMLKHLLRPSEFEEMIVEIKVEMEILDEYIKIIPVSDILVKIGFPPNWYDIKEM